MMRTLIVTAFLLLLMNNNAYGEENWKTFDFENEVISVEEPELSFVQDWFERDFSKQESEPEMLFKKYPRERLRPNWTSNILGHEVDFTITENYEDEFIRGLVIF